MRIMILLPKIHFLTNLYAHVENLSRYHRWSDKRYIDYFASNVKSPLGKRHLIRYKAFRKRHLFDRVYEDVFTSRNLDAAFKRIKHLKKSEKQELEKVFLYFMDDFRKEWSENIKGIIAIKDPIIKWWESEGPNFARKARFISNKLPGRVPVFLCWNPIEFKATMFGRHSILVEMHESVPSNDLFSVIPHELAHMIDISYGPDSFAMFRKWWGASKAMLVHEAVISLLFRGPKNPIQDSWSKEVNRLAAKIGPALNSSISSGETYKDFLLRIPNLI